MPPRAKHRTGAMVELGELRGGLWVVARWLFALSLAAPGVARCQQATPPHLDAAGAAGYAAFLAAGRHKAFVIAPGGAWAWKGGELSAAAAVQSALRECEQATVQRCVAYAADDDKVFDAARWPTLWAPYPTRAEAMRAPTGAARGERFFNLAFRDPDGRPTAMAKLRGSVVLVHFWASWCGPCRREMPQLQELARRLGQGSGVKLVLLQVREPVTASRAWLRQQRIELPIHDSGASAGAAGELTLADGRPIKDRELAASFPTSYVLDKQGIVLFAHAGAVADWSEYLPFLRHAAAAPGRH